MRVSRSLALLVGSFFVYAAVSCASSAMDDASQRARVEDAVADLGLDSNFVDAIRDSLADGAPSEAMAAPPAVDEIPCSTPWVTKSYAGRTQAEISLGSVLVCDGDASPPAGYSCIVAGRWVKDGEVAVYCGTKTTAKVRFVMP